MEIHVELATRSKMFSRSANVAHPDHYDAPPNSLVDPVVLGLPGALPVMNRRAVEMAMMVGLALGCSVGRSLVGRDSVGRLLVGRLSEPPTTGQRAAPPQTAQRAVPPRTPRTPRTRWDRKNYFYPDLPKGYQISQYDAPLCGSGSYELVLEDGSTRTIRITRAHLEEDAGKLGHELPGGGHYDGTLVDLNRAGTPLLEIVTEPDFESAEHAVAFARQLRTICRYLGVSEGILQRGQMRFEPNINVVIETESVTRETPIVEIKNLNSFRALEGAIRHEHQRQIEAWHVDRLEKESGNKSTRGWDDANGRTFLQRSKEEAQDYRYFPEPDLVPVEVDDAWLERVRAEIPELPQARFRRFVDELGLATKDAATLVEERATCEFFEKCVLAAIDRAGDGSNSAELAQAVSKLLLNAGAKRANEQGQRVDELGISAGQVAELVDLRVRETVGSSASDELFGLLCETREDAESVAAGHNLLQVRDESQLAAWCDEAIAAEPQAARDVAEGKDQAIGRLIGRVMKISHGQADAKAVRQALIEKLR